MWLNQIIFLSYINMAVTIPLIIEGTMGIAEGLGFIGGGTAVAGTDIAIENSRNHH